MYVRRTRSGKKWQVTVNHLGTVRTATAPTRPEAIQKGAELVIDMGGTPSGIADQVTVAVVLADHAAANTERWSPQYAADFARITTRLPAIVTARNYTQPFPKAL